MPRPQVLLVEDDFQVRLVMEHVLVDSYDVDVTETASAASDLLERRPYDLVLADGRLVIGTGMRLADQALEKGAAVLIATGYAFDLPKDKFKRFEYLLKPVRPDELLQAVERTLRAKNTT
jgi:DNA-binding NtrC family response regulator